MSAEQEVGFKFRIVHGDGREEVFVVDSARALVGSATHCEVRLEPDEAGHEHLEVYIDRRTIHFATRAYGLSAALPTLNGTTTAEGEWPAGSVLALGRVELRAEVVDVGTPKAKPPIWALLLAIPLVGISIAAAALARTPPQVEPPIPEAPALLPPKSEAKCPPVSAEQRPALAAERLRIALAKRERGPFAPGDGLDAVILFETAAACYRELAMPADAATADRSADLLRAKLDDEYRVRRVRLEHAYRVRDVTAVKREIAVLGPMLAGRPSPYAEWLGALDRAATAELEQRGRLY